MTKEDDDEEYSIIDKINDYFQMPIYYNDKKVELKNNIITDLELINTFDTSCNTIYSFCFNNDNDVSHKLTEQMAKYYTTDINFLKDNQKLIKEYISPETAYTNISKNYKKIIDIWNELKTKIPTCTNEKCWADKLNIKTNAFSPKAPREWKKNKWLSNFDIESVLKQYKEAYPNFDYYSK
jgi:hypothetical protein